MTRKLRAVVNSETRSVIDPPARHTVAGGVDTLLPMPDHLIMDCNDGSVMLLRSDISGQFCGDTWHPTVEEAIRQAEFEYGVRGGDWVDIQSVQSGR